MGFKVDTKGSSKSNSAYEQDENKEGENKPFVKNTEDNKIFPEIQVKDINTLIHEKTVGKMDSDTMLYQAASNVETKYIVVKHLKEDVSVELKGIREFKGLTKEISSTSWLGVENEKRKINKLPLWKVDDFEVTPQAKLKYPKEKAIEQAKISVYTKLKNIRLQYGIQNIDLVMGEGDNFRHELPLCKPYKGNRTETLRPIILKDIRQWAMDEMGGELAQPRADGNMVEADDLVEYYGSLGYQSYRKTGKFDYVVIASDKDAMGNPKLLINPDTYTGEGNPLRGQYKLPQTMLIEASDKTEGGIDLVVTGTKKEIKGYGLKWIAYQSFLGEDSADNYSALKHLGRKFNYGVVSAYEDLVNTSTPKEVLQKAVDVFAELLPYGVQYTTYDGRKMDVDTMTYMDTYFKVAYMLRSSKDTMDFYKLCEVFTVDTSKIVGNNTMTPPQRTFMKDTAENKVESLKELCEDVLPELKGYKSLKKDLLVGRLDTISNKLDTLLDKFEGFYEMKQFKKEDHESTK